MAKITDYPSITTIDANTILLADGSSGTGKILASDMAKYALETYAGSTLAGSAQSVKAALTGLAPQVKTAISDLSVIQPGEQGYFQLNASVSPIGKTAYFTVWCTGNVDRHGLIAVYTAEEKTRFFANAGHANGGVFAWRGWQELADASSSYVLTGGTVVAANTDLDTLTTPGNYYSWDSINVVNGPMPYKAGFVLKVESSAGQLNDRYVRQMFFYYNKSTLYTRVRVASGWQEWLAVSPAYALDYEGMIRIAVAGITDLNTVMTPGSYVATSSGVAASLTNSPVTDTGFSLHVESVAGGSGQYIIQTIKRIASNNGETYIRTYTGSTWGAWEKLPTRAEVDALSEVKAGTFTPDSSLTNLGENGIKVWQSGKVVTVSGYLQASFPGTTNIQVGAISGVGVPQNPIRVRGGCGPNAYTTGNDAYVAITRDGKVTAYSAGAGTSLYFTIAYITA